MATCSFCVPSLVFDARQGPMWDGVVCTTTTTTTWIVYHINANAQKNWQNSSTWFDCDFYVHGLIVAI